MVEMALTATLLLVLALGFVDFGYAFYQWNAASKAVQVGARLASVSSPVAVGIVNEAGLPSDTSQVGNPVPAGAYDYVCTADSTGHATCTCKATTTGTCSNAADQAAFDLIYAGDDGVCQGKSDPGRPGMCDFFPELKKNQVKIEYVATGLGYWTRPGGPIPTIKLSISNYPFKFIFLGNLIGLNNFMMPTMLTTATGEDLDTNYRH